MAYVEDSNTSQLTITSTLAELLDTPSSLSFAVGDRVILSGHVHATKGSAAGSLIVKFTQKSGSAAFQWLPNSGGLIGFMQPRVPAGELCVLYCPPCVLRCITSGSAIFMVQAESKGSNSTIEPGGCAISAENF